MDYAPQYRLDPLPRSFAADAHGCIMVGSLRIYRIQGCGAMIERPMASSPRFVCIIRKAVCSDSWCLTSKAHTRDRQMSRRLEISAGKINARNPKLVCGRRLGV